VRAGKADVHLIVLAKSPVAGRVKTRLCPPYSLAEAAIIAEAALRDTLDAVATTPASARTLVLDGAIGAWLPAGFSVIPQRGKSLDERLAAAFEDAQQTHRGPLLLVGMDTPQITPDLLLTSCNALLTAGTDAVLGPATDGGWWALGLRHADSRLLTGVPMSTPLTGAAQLERLVGHGLAVSMLAELVDVDDAASADAVAGAAPDSRFTRALWTLAMAS
jgi:rSAM/selenodomain-associated transferase 1